MRMKVWLSICIMCSFILVSCTPSSANQKNTALSIPETQDTLRLTPDFSYEVIAQKPHVLVDQLGYLPDHKKIFFVLGEELTEEFSIRHGLTGETVYTGVLRRAGKSGKTGKTIYIGDFSDLNVNGLYLVNQKEVGDSKSFYINKLVYRDVSLRLYDKIEEYEFEKTSELCYCLSNIMLTNEIYKDTMENKSFLKEQISKLLLQQEEKTGAVCENMSNTQNTGRDISLCATAEFAGVMAQYYYNYKDDDFDFSVSCLNAATRAYRYIEKYRDNTDIDTWYFASAELYRITGQYKYRAAIKEYDEYPEELRNISDCDFTMLGDIAYLTTTYRADLQRCQDIMDNYMDIAQNISEQSLKEHYYVTEDIEKTDQKKLLQDMMVLGIVNYVLSGREYAAIQENYIHYFLGRNETSTNYLLDGYLAPQKNNENSITGISECIFILGNVSHK